MLTNIIPDGYEEPGYVAEQQGLYRAVRFVYRPMLAEARDTIQVSLRAKPAAECCKMLAAAMASRIVKWDVVDAANKPLPPDAATILKLRPRLFDRLYSVICGDSSSDIDPKAAPQATNVDAEAALQAAIDGRPVGDVKQEADTKNLLEG